MAALLVLVTLLALSVAERTDVFRLHDPADPWIRHEGEIQRTEDGHEMVVHFLGVNQCVKTIFVDLHRDSPTSVIAYKIIGRENKQYLWEEIGRSSVSGSGEINVLEETCIAHLKLAVDSGNYVENLGLDSHDMPMVEGGRKRAFAAEAKTCAFALSYSSECAPEGSGTYCATFGGVNRCGCEEDADCYNNAVFPFCDKDSDPVGFCERCTQQVDILDNEIAGGITSQNSRRKNDFYCRKRFPSRFQFFAATTTPGYPQDESPAPVDPAPFARIPNTGFREACLVGGDNIGTCSPCDTVTDILLGLNGYFPAYSSFSPIEQQVLRGSFHCRDMYPGIAAGRVVETQSLNARPLCVSVAIFQAVGLGTGPYNAGVVTQNWSESTDGNAQNTINNARTATVKDWKGACVPCALDPDGVGAAGVTNFHGFCSIVDALRPICSGVADGCKKCASNAECAFAGDHSTCKTAGAANAGLCTGGHNCYTTGACVDCRTKPAAQQCLDDLGGQTVCNQDTGICEDLAPCTGEDKAGTGSFVQASQNTGAELCTGTLTPNCFSDGFCGLCSTGKPCTGDLNSGDNLCTSNGICAPRCTGEATTPANRLKNSPTSGVGICTGGQNCFKDGLCRVCSGPSDCLNNDINALDTVCVEGVCVEEAKCTGESTQAADFPQASLNNGLFKCGTGNCYNSGTCSPCNGAGNGCTNDFNSGVSSDPVCSTNGICQPGCIGEIAPSGRSKGSPSSGATICSSGKNCMSDKLCRPCTGQTDCDANDPESGDVECVSGICVQVEPCRGESSGRTPQQASFQVGVQCGSNENCFIPSGQNGGSCRVCTGNSDCENNDQDSDDDICDNGVCRPSCTGEAAQHSSLDKDSNIGAHPCPATGSPNCYVDGTCRPCSPSVGCSNDLAGDDVCETSTSVCINGCDGNFGENTPNACGASARNCHDDGLCYNCGSPRSGDADCAANDGPPGRGGNTECRADGICVDPFCLHNSDCPFSGGVATKRNCGYDGQCYDCRVSGCTASARDGPDPNVAGSIGIPDQPNCDEETGICVNYCTKDADCSDPCEPHCEEDRGCCVECVSDDHCPFLGTTDESKSPGSIDRVNPTYPGQPNYPDGFLLKWRNEQEAMTQCNPRLHMCQAPRDCDIDEDCDGDTPACATGSHTCVECVHDGHCGGDTPACATGSSICVECVHDGHCDGDTPACSPHNSCVACMEDDDCAADLHCSDVNCVECAIDSHCDSDEQCVEFKCETDDDSSSYTLSVSFLLMFVSTFLQM